MAIKFENMCDRCYRMVGDNEKIFAFKLIDDDNKERVFKGHKECLDEMVEIISQLYSLREDEKDEKEDSAS